MILASLTVAGLLFILWPLPADLLEARAVLSLTFTDRTGGELRQLRSREDGRSQPLVDSVIPPQVRAAFLSAEDKRFESHIGLDPLAIARAIRQNLRAGRIVSGASTITQQLARRLRPHERDLSGKVGEAFWALRLNLHLSRDRILLEYLNRVPLGNSLFGVEAAAEFYFARPASSLSFGQAALLAGMARAPARYDPFRHPEAARERMVQVLELMAANDFISAEELRVSREAPLDEVAARARFEAPHLLAHLTETLSERGLDEAMRIETTLDPSLQSAVEEAISLELEGLVDRRVGQAAAIVIDNKSGDILAYVGSADFWDEAVGGQNDGVRALRQPGSALKPFAYGLALASGRTPATVLSDVEVHLATPTGDYVPRNYDRRVHGPVRLRAALANSYNVPAVRLADELGPEKVLDVLRAAGFESLTEDASHYGVGVILGNGDVTLRQAARAYRGLALGGVVGPLHEIRGAWDARGEPIPIEPELETHRFLPADAVALVTDIMSDEEARAPAFGLDNALRLPFPVAVKTGTSRAYVDNWTLGFTKERTVGVWVGNFDGTPMRRVSGITGAGPLFRRVMTLAMRGIRPATLVDRNQFARADICPLSGGLVTPACPGVLHEVFLPGMEPTAYCGMHRFSTELSQFTGKPRAITDVGPAFYAWARGEGLNAGPWHASGGGGSAPSHAAAYEQHALRPGVANEEGVSISGPGELERASRSANRGTLSGGRQQLRLLMPSDGDEYLLEPGIPIADQTVPVRAMVSACAKHVRIRVDGQTPTRLAPPYSTRIEVGRGRHRVELLEGDSDDPVATARFRVR